MPRFHFDAFNPLDTLISATSITPVIGPAIAGAARTAMQLAPFGPAVAEFGSKMTTDAFKDAPPVIRDAVDFFARKTEEALLTISNKLLELKGVNDAVRPTVMGVAEMTKLQVLAGATPQGGDVFNLLKAMFRIQFAENTVRLKLQQQTFKAMGGGLAEFLKQSYNQ